MSIAIENQGKEIEINYLARFDKCLVLIVGMLF